VPIVGILIDTRVGGVVSTVGKGDMDGVWTVPVGEITLTVGAGFDACWNDTVGVAIGGGVTVDGGYIGLPQS
jgi:hypothetical protein